MTSETPPEEMTSLQRQQQRHLERAALVRPEDVKEKYHLGTQAGRLTESFGVPPFSTAFNARGGVHMRRKRFWAAVGVDNDDGRKDSINFSPSLNLVAGKEAEGSASIFNAATCEILVNWYSPLGGLVLDPFAGGSVRGVVSLASGRDYHGIEIRPEQVESNRKALEKALKFFEKGRGFSGKIENPRERCSWVVGDSLEMLDDAPEADMLLACPPYYSLEKYEGGPGDLSMMATEEFEERHAAIIKKAVSKLKENRFAIWVVGNAREGKKGFWQNLYVNTYNAFRDAGCHHNDDLIQFLPVSSASIRARKQFEANRRTVRVHEFILCFVKGDPSKATKACGKVELLSDEAVVVPSSRVTSASFLPPPPEGLKNRFKKALAKTTDGKDIREDSLAGRRHAQREGMKPPSIMGGTEKAARAEAVPEEDLSKYL